MPKSQPPRKRRTKKPITAAVHVIVDDEPVEALDDARAALEQAETEARANRERRIARATLSITDEPPDRARLLAEITVDEEIDAELAPLHAAITEAEQAVRDATDVYRFQAIGGHAYDDLIREHPATDEDHELARSETRDPNARASYHLTSFAPAIIAASSADGLTADEAKALWADWNDAERLEMFATALAVNRNRRTASLAGKGFGPTRSAVR